MLQHRVNIGKVLIREFDDGRVLPDPVWVGRSRNRDDLGHAGTLGQAQEPADGDLAGCAASSLCDGLDVVNEFEVGSEVLGGELGRVPTEVVERDVV